MRPYLSWGKKSEAHIGILTLVLFLIVYVFASLQAEPQQQDHVKARLVSEVRSIQPGQPFCVALKLKMDKHWHIYWKNPGDAGDPPKIDWNLPDGFVPGDIQWPYPQKFETSQIINFGYEGEVLLITEIEAPQKLQSGSKVKISASVDWLVCRESCISGHADLAIDLPIKDKEPKVNSRWAGYFKRTRMNLPQAPSGWKITASLKDSQILIQAVPPQWLKGDLTDLTFFPEQVGLVDYSLGQSLKKSKDGYLIEIQRSKLSRELPSRLKGVLFSQLVLRDSRQKLALRIDVPL